MTGGYLRYLLLLLAIPLVLFASPRGQVKKGNSAAEAGNPDAAMTHYKRALDQHGDSSVVLYDVGNVLYESGNYEQAMQAYAGSLSPKETLPEQAGTLYNLGNTLFQNQKYDKAAEAYIESLKRNPNDLEAKYNLELAKRMLQQQQQQQQQNQDQKDQPQEQQEQQDQQQQQQQKKKKDSQDEQKEQEQQQQNHQQDQEQQQQQAQQRPDQQMSPEEAERLLNALLQNEQNALKDAKKVKVMARAKREKDW